jgi:hypothetical protein
MKQGTEFALTHEAPLEERRAVSRTEPSRRFFRGMALAFLVTAFAGFAPTYYLKSVTHAPPLSPLLHVHGLVFTAWLVLLFTQTSLVAAHRVDWHRRLGLFGVLVATAMLVLGPMAAIAAARRGFAVGDLHGMNLLVFQLGAIVLFAGFVGAALYQRRRPELHRRLMLLATINLLPPAIVRLPLVGGRPIVALLLCTLFIAPAMLHDLRTRGRVHPVYLWGGLAILLSGPARAILGQTPAWQALALALVK